MKSKKDNILNLNKILGMKNEVKKGNTNGNVNVNLDKGDSLG